MTLSDIKIYLQQHQRATLTDLANHFRCDEQTLKPMLQHWVHKGKVQHIHQDACTKGCCGAGELNIYVWTAGKPESFIHIAADNSSPCSSVSHSEPSHSSIG